MGKRAESIEQREEAEVPRRFDGGGQKRLKAQSRITQDQNLIELKHQI